MREFWIQWSWTFYLSTLLNVNHELLKSSRRGRRWNQVMPQSLSGKSVSLCFRWKFKPLKLWNVVSFLLSVVFPVPRRADVIETSHGDITWWLDGGGGAPTSWWHVLPLSVPGCIQTVSQCTKHFVIFWYWNFHGWDGNLHLTTNNVMWSLFKLIWW